MATMSGVVLSGDSTVKHVDVDVPEPDPSSRTATRKTRPARPVAPPTKGPPAKSASSSTDPRQERLHKLMHSYQIWVALHERFGPNDVSLDVRTDQQHPLLEHEMQIATSTHGGAVLILTFITVDLWTAILTGMAFVRQSGYVPVAVQAHSNDEKLPYGAAGTNGAR